MYDLILEEINKELKIVKKNYQITIISRRHRKK